MASWQRVLLGAIFVVCFTETTFAQDGTPDQGGIRQAVTVYAAAAAADVGTTFYAIHYGAHETNPAISWMQPKTGPTTMLLVGSAVDAATVTILTRWLGPNHPRLLKVGLYTAAGFRGALAARNVRNAHQYRDFALSR